MKKTLNILLTPLLVTPLAALHTPVSRSTIVPISFSFSNYFLVTQKLGEFVSGLITIIARWM